MPGTKSPLNTPHWPERKWICGGKGTALNLGAILGTGEMPQEAALGTHLARPPPASTSSSGLNAPTSPSELQKASPLFILTEPFRSRDGQPRSR